MTMIDDYDEAFVWAPRYISILEKRQSTDPEEAQYYSQFGFDKLTLPASTDIPYIHTHWQKLIARFNERYYFRRVGNETLERWQIRMQNKFDEVVDEMERAYRLYATTSNIDEVTPGTKTTYASGTSHTGTDGVSTQALTKAISTPDSSINEDDDYADALTKDSSSTTNTYSTNNSRTGYDKTEILGPDVLAGVNKSISDWNDIDTFFISQFENLFLNVFG